MKIAIYHFLPSGGAKRALYELVNGLNKFNHEFDLYIPTTECEEFCDLRPIVGRTYDYNYKIPNLPLPMVTFLFKLWSFEKLQKKIAQDIDQKKYDFVFVHHCKLTQSPSILRFLKTPTIYFCQEPFRLYYENRFYQQEINKVSFWKKPIYALNIFMRSRIDKSNAQKASLIVVNSYYSAESVFKAYGVYPKVCYLGVDFEKFRKIEKIKKENMILSVGTMKSHKSFDFLIESMPYISMQNKPRLTIIFNRKDPIYEKSLRDKAANYQVNLIILHNISDKELVENYNRAKLTINAASLEPFGLTTLESMACETPVIGIKEGGIRELIEHDINGLLVDRDQKKLGKSISELLTDDERYTKLRNNCRKSILKKWKWENAVSRMDEIINDFDQ